MVCAEPGKQLEGIDDTKGGALHPPPALSLPQSCGDDEAGDVCVCSQAFLGLTFNWGALLGWCNLTHTQCPASVSGEEAQADLHTCRQRVFSRPPPL